MVDFSGIDISVDEMVSLLRRDLQFNTICQKVLSISIIREEAAQRSLEVSEQEIQSECDSIRRELRLESAEKTFEWLIEQHLSADEWEESIRDRLLAQKLADTLFQAVAKAKFEQNKLDYDQVELYRIIVPNFQLAQELIYQIEENEINFFEAAHTFDIDPLRRAYCGYEGQLSRWALEPDIAASIFEATPHEVIGPFPLKEGHALYFIDKFITPELTDSLYQEIRDREFKQWLASEIKSLQP